MLLRLGDISTVWSNKTWRVQVNFCGHFTTSILRDLDKAFLSGLQTPNRIFFSFPVEVSLRVSHLNSSSPICIPPVSATMTQFHSHLSFLSLSAGKTSLPICCEGERCVLPLREQCNMLVVLFPPPTYLSLPFFFSLSPDQHLLSKRLFLSQSPPSICCRETLLGNFDSG